MSRPGTRVLPGVSVTDFPAWTEVRTRNADWLLRWEPRRLPGQPDVTTDRDAFSVRCSARERERQLGTGYGFGVFVEGRFAGEINLSAIQRGPFQSAPSSTGSTSRSRPRVHAKIAGRLIRFAVDDCGLHRLQIAIIPRNTAAPLVEKVKIPRGGRAERT